MKLNLILFILQHDIILLRFMSANKVGERRRNGLINILFHQTKTIDPRPGNRDENQFSRFMEEHVFIPRNKVKNIKILKINDTIYTNFNSLRANHIKRMLVDGSHLSELTPSREIITRNQLRKTCERVFSPQLSIKRERDIKRNLSCYDQKMQESFCNNEQSKVQKSDESPSQVVLLSIQQKMLEQSTTSSSNRNIRTSLRYKKIEKKIDPEKQIALDLKKEMLRYYSNPSGSPENITAKAYVVYECKPNQRQQSIGKCLHAAYNTKINSEIASLTKIMTCILTLQLCKKFTVDTSSTFVKISNFQTRIQGTSAELQVNELYSIEQLLYGMMLPSGNDASLALSAFCGELLQKSISNRSLCNQQVSKKYCCRKFVMQMNKKCRELGMKRTIYSNSHGLANILNKTCISDQLILINYALRNDCFRKIVSSRYYEAIVSKQTDQPTQKRSIRWENTHKLVLNKPEMYIGIKTGTTDAAGPCLASLLSIQGREFIIIVLNSRSSKWRYKDTQNLRQWLCKKEKF